MHAKQNTSLKKRIIEQYIYLMSEKKEIVGSHVLLILMGGLFLHILFPPAYGNAQLEGKPQQEYIEHYSSDINNGSTCILNTCNASK